MPKERNYNPAQAFHKKRKQDHIKKVKAEKQRLRDEKLAKRDPRKIEAQIQEFKELEIRGQLSALDRSNLEILESDLKKIKRARKHLGPIIESEKTKAREAKEEKLLQKIPKNPKKSIYYDPVFNPYGVPPPGMPYKEWSDIEESEISSEEPSTPESISAIPMPEGSPPPSSCLNKKERKKRLKYLQYKNKMIKKDINNTSHSSQNRHPEKKFKGNNSLEESLPSSQPTPTIVYSADSILRNLKKESTAFIPTSVRQKTISIQNPLLKKNVTTPKPIFKPKTNIHINAAPDISEDV